MKKLLKLAAWKILRKHFEIKGIARKVDILSQSRREAMMAIYESA